MSVYCLKYDKKQVIIMAEETKRISIPSSLYRKIEGKIKETGFTSVDDYVVYVLREILSEDEEDEFTEEDEEKVRERLRSLGYLD